LTSACTSKKTGITEDNVQNITKAQSGQAGGTVVESGIAGWWFCCGDVCYSCTGETAGSVLLNCTAAITFPPDEQLDPNDTVPKMLMSLPEGERLVNIPLVIWNKLDSAEKKRIKFNFEN